MVSWPVWKLGPPAKASDLTHGSDPTVLDTLGAAYAEEGQFKQALETAQYGPDLAASDTALKQMITARILLYRENQPYRN